MTLTHWLDASVGELGREVDQHLQELLHEDVVAWVQAHRDVLLQKLREDIGADPDGINVAPAGTGQWA